MGPYYIFLISYMVKQTQKFIRMVFFLIPASTRWVPICYLWLVG